MKKIEPKNKPSNMEGNCPNLKLFILLKRIKKTIKEIIIVNNKEATKKIEKFDSLRNFNYLKSLKKIILYKTFFCTQQLKKRNILCL